MSFKAYASAFYQYLGNYHSFGSRKFKPEIPPNKFTMILMRHPLFKSKTQKGKKYKKLISEIYP
jgi:dipeptidyl-peptidase-3